jgi:hypothetical protein
VPPEPVVLRWDLTLPDHALIVRGGADWRKSVLWTNANSVHLQTAGTWGICVGGAVDLTPQEIADQMPYRGDWMRSGTYGPLRQAGYRFALIDGEAVHGVLLLNQAPGGADWPGWDLLPPFFGEREAIDR